MRALVIQSPAAAGSPVSSVLKVVNDWPEPPPPGPGQALVRTLASALNHLDLWVCRGVPGVNLTYPRVSGSDACGIVEAVGAGVDATWVGRHVVLNAALPTPTSPLPDDPPGTHLAPLYELIGEHHNGAHCEKFLAPVCNLDGIPDNADADDAAAFGLTFLTAWSMLATKANLRAGQTVLITGIGGGVAVAALAIAKHFGCPTCVTSRHQWKLDRARELGASWTILDGGQDWSRDVRDWTKKRGVDVAVDSSGKATHIKCIKSLARGGVYLTPGCTSGADATTDLARIFWNQLRIFGSTMGTPDEFREVVSLFNSGALKPQVDREYSADEGAAAYARLEAGEQFGKIVIRWGKPAIGA